MSDSSSSCSDSLENSEELDYPIGFNPNQLLQQRSDQTKQESVLVKKLEKNKENNIPKELQYEVLLKRAVHVLKNHDEIQAKIKLPLEVKREFGNKTLMNLQEIANILNRDSDHIKKYLFSELATNGSVNAKGELLMKGNFTKPKIQDVLRLYIENFMVCTSCDSVLNTEIIRENRLYFLNCLNCGSRKYVGNIVEGFQKKGKSNAKLRGFI